MLYKTEYKNRVRLKFFSGHHWCEPKCLSVPHLAPVSMVCNPLLIM